MLCPEVAGLNQLPRLPHQASASPVVSATRMGIHVAVLGVHQNRNAQPPMAGGAAFGTSGLEFCFAPKAELQIRSENGRSPFAWLDPTLPLPPEAANARK